MHDRLCAHGSGNRWGRLEIAVNPDQLDVYKIYRITRLIGDARQGYSDDAYALIRYPVLKIHHTATMHIARKLVIIPMLTSTPTSATP